MQGWTRFLTGLVGVGLLAWLGAACGDDGDVPSALPSDGGAADGRMADAQPDGPDAGVGDDGGPSDGTVPVDAGPPPTVEPLFPTAGAGWNDWVINEGTTVVEASDTPCDPELATARADACLHAGELRVAELPQLDDCDGVEAEDDQGAFEWTCFDEGAGPVRVISTGFADDRGLSDLLDWSSSPPTWREMVLTIDAGARQIRSVPSTWWSTPIQVANEDGTLSEEGVIHAVTTDTTAAFVLAANRITLVTGPGVTVSAPEGSDAVIEVPSGDFRWIEATIDATGSTNAIAFTGEPSRFAVVHDSLASGGEEDGLVVRCDGCRLSEIVARDFGGTGVTITGAFPRIRDLAAVDNRGHGIVFVTADGAGGGDVRGLTANRNQMMGILLGDAPPGLSGMRLEDVVAVRNRQIGMRVPAGSRHVLRNVTAVSNGLLGGLPGISFGASRSVISNVVVANNGNDGMTVSGSASDNLFSSVLAVNNRGAGARHSVTARGATVWTNVLAAQNGAAGMVPAGGGTIMSVAAFNNGADGLFMEDTRGMTLLHVATSDNGSGADDHDIEITGPHALGIVFRGILQVGSAPESCAVIDAGPTPGMDSTCGMVGESDAMLQEGSLGGAFVGPLMEDDRANADDMAAMAAFSSITDWTSFARPLRAWGVDGDELAARRGACFEGETCRIYDWSLMEGADALLGVVPVPADGNAVLVHRFETTDPMACEEIPGAVEEEGFCQVTFLRNAVEIADDGAGNDNTLCEGGERCLYTPNIGVYQGHGPLEMVADITSGTLDGITLLAHETNGR